MLSKQEKLRYGQILRQQMKQKQEKKKMEDLDKRGGGQQQNNQKKNNYNEFQKQTNIQNQPVYYEKQNANTRQFVDPKEQLIKKMETQDYNPFGRGGGGAPNKKIPQHPAYSKNNSQPTNLYLNPDEMQQINFQNSNRNENSRVYTQDDLRREYQYQQKYMQQNQNISPQTRNNYGDPYQKYPQQPQSYQNYPPSYSSIPQNGSFNQIPQNNNVGFNSRQEYVQAQLNRQNNYANRPQQNYVQQQYNPNVGYKSPNLNQNYPPIEDSYPNDSLKNYPPQNLTRQNANNNQIMPPQRTNTYQNEQIQEVYKKGGRNLLKLENQTIDQHMVKQRQKQQIQKYLKLQIQQAQRKKKQEKQRIKRQQLQEQRKQLQYIDEQKKKIQDQQRKKQQEKQKVINQNLKNLEKRKQLQDQAKRKIIMENRTAQQRQKMEKQRERNQQQQAQLSQQQRKKQSIQVFNEDRNNSRKFRVSEEDATSVIQSDTSQIQKGFNTALSREFFKKQRQKDPNKQQHDRKLQAFTQQIQKMRGQINNQGQMFQQQIVKVKMQAQRAQQEKRRAQQQIQRLKMELKKKMDQDNQKLLRALQKTNNHQSRPPPVQNRHKNNQRRLDEGEYDEIVQNQSHQYQNFSKNKPPLRQKQNERLVKKKFEVFQNNQHLQQSNASGLMSLDGDSKKIPLYLQNANNLTMSQVQDFAKQTHYFNKRQKSPKIPKQQQSKQLNKNYNNGFGESIVQVDEQRDYESRKSNRQRNNNNSRSRLNQERDELDRMVQSRQKSRGGWGQMSSVNSDITKQIQELLKKKDANSNNRPSSISNAGKQSLARQGINYEGMSLHSINGGTLNSNNTLDIDRIYNRNQARLKQLKNLGVQTINTNNDDELNKLDQLLNKYK